MARFIKGFLKYIFYSTIITLISAIIFFFLSPYIVSQYEWIPIILTWISLILILILIVGLIKGNLKIFGFKNRRQCFLSLLIVVTCAISTVTVALFNSAIDEVIASLYSKDSITLSDKIEVFSEIGENIKNEYKSKQYSKDMESQTFGDITFYYSLDDEEMVNELINTVIPLDEMIESFIPTYDTKPVNVILHNDEDKYRKATGTPQNSLNVGIFYKNMIHLVNTQTGKGIIERVGGKSFSAADITDVFAHEYSHYKCDVYFAENNIKGGKVPMWLEEGLASYFKYALNGGFPILEFRDAEPRLDSLTTLNQWEKYGESGTSIHYSKAYMAVYHLIELKGEGVFHDITNLIKDGKPFDEAFKTAVGLFVNEFEEKILLSHVQGNGDA